MSKQIEGLNFNKLIPHLNREFKEKISENKMSLCDIFILSDSSEKHLKALIKQEHQKQHDTQKEKIGNI